MRFILRLVILLVVLWAGGFGIFVATMPGPLEGAETDAIVVPTGGAGRIDRGLKLIAQHAAKRMLVTGVAPAVRPAELAAQYRGYSKVFACCVDLGHDAVDTRSNADETAAWLKEHGYKSVRLVTSDWHLARARLELVNALGSDVTVVGDGVATRPKFLTLLSEYNKLIVRRVAILSGGLW
ncbi:YdcF family protein [Sphingomonas immobilis]|uniref:YdcF family protein n=1 Tax=Sphingomonas immobilis TaxID=3063997 RepID=A0ABT8ZWJ1_9SPHN|nr:YdcF family protein [Sphingomonas sp. CA1-15]MDO7841385.1 YdcF family protein [Sphingomonas sp. CA1-15]